MAAETKRKVKEHVIKEYPNTTFWLEGRQVRGAGNLILTTDRLVYLNQVPVIEGQRERVLQLAKEGFDQVMDYALKLHKKNFEIPLEQIDQVKMGVFSYFPLPRFCIRIEYHGAKRNSATQTVGFWFRIPLLKGFFQLELTLVTGWINAIKGAVKQKKKTMA